MASDLDIPLFRYELYEARNNREALANWAQRHGPALCDAVEATSAVVSSVVSDEIVLGEPDEFGSYITEVGRVNPIFSTKTSYAARLENQREHLRTETGQLKLFDTPLEAAKALRDGAKGAGG